MALDKIKRQGKIYSTALLLGLLAAAAGAVRTVPEFGVIPHFWGVFSIAAVTFLGLRPGLFSVLVAGIIIALLDDSGTLQSGAILLYAAETVFIGWQLHKNKNLEVLIAAVKFWLIIALPILTIYHWPLFELSTSAGLLLVGNEALSRLICAALVQWICLNPAIVKRLDIGHRDLVSRCQWPLLRLVYILFPVFAILPALVVIQVDNSSQTKTRMHSLQANAELAISKAQRDITIALFNLQNRVLKDLETRQVTAEYLMAITAQESVICGAFDTENRQLEIDNCGISTSARGVQDWRDHAHEEHADALLPAYQNIPGLALMQAGPIDLVIDLRVMAARINDMIAASNLGFVTIKIYPAEYSADAVNTSRTVVLGGNGVDSVRSRLEQTVRRIIVIDSPVLLNLSGSAGSSIGLRITASTNLAQQVEVDLNMLTLELLAAAFVFSIIFIMFVLWLRQTLPALNEFVNASIQWQPGQSFSFKKTSHPFVIREFETAQTTIQSLVENFNDTYTRLERADRALEQTASQLRSVFSSVRSPMLVLDEKLQVVMLNSACEGIQDSIKPYLVEARQHLRQPPGQATASEFSEAIVNAILDGRSAQDIELKFQRDNEDCHLLVSVGPLQGWQEKTAETGCIIAFSDITMFVQTRNQLVHSTKLASLGELAAGMAHELNQPLNVIRMSCHNLLRSLSKGAFTQVAAEEKLNRINAQVDRAAKIIDGMKAFGRKANTSAGSINPSTAINMALDLLKEQLAIQSIKINHTPLVDQITVLADAISLEQIIINLVTNARDAIKDSALNSGEIFIRETVVDGKFHVEVEDNGGGIPSASIKNIFDPFFTTKEVGKGTGLGLSISYGILQEIGGTIEVDNREKGACFTFEIPLAKTAP